jgi:flagellar basal body P-ring formation protein FlgA
MLPFLFLFAEVPEAFENLEALDQRVAAIAPDAELTDKRMKLARCPDQPIIASPAGGVIVIRCPPKAWRFRVMVRAEKADSAQAEIFVHKGQMIEAVSEGHGFSVSTNMIAVEDGSAGQTIRVKSPLSPVQTTATVKARGVVSF